MAGNSKRRKQRKLQEETQKANLGGGSAHLTLEGPIIDNECRVELVVCNAIDQTKRHRVTAIIDTGCTSLAIRDDIALSLGLQPIDRTDVQTANGIATCPVVAALVLLVGQQRHVEAVLPFSVMERDRMADEMLLGMSALVGGVLIVDRVQDRWKIKIQRLGGP